MTILFKKKAMVPSLIDLIMVKELHSLYHDSIIYLFRVYTDRFMTLRWVGWDTKRYLSLFFYLLNLASCLPFFMFILVRCNCHWWDWTIYTQVALERKSCELFFFFLKRQNKKTLKAVQPQANFALVCFTVQRRNSSVYLPRHRLQSEILCFFFCHGRRTASSG